MSRSRMYSHCSVVLVFLLFLSSPVAATIGDAGRGEALFVGKTAFELGGAPCLACHKLSGLGLAGAASYGPDLSGLYNDYEAEGVMAVLESLAFPSMEAIYAKRPLTETERLDLTAFFAQSTDEQAPAAKSLAGLILLGVIIVFAIVGITGLRRFKGARRPLVEQANKQRGVKA